MAGKREEKKDLAKVAAEKRAAFGADINMDDYSPETAAHPYQDDLSAFSQAEQDQMLMAGVDFSAKNRSGTFVQKDLSVVHSRSTQEGMEIMDIEEALKQYDWLHEYWWQAVPVDMDKYTSRAELHQEHGYFIRSMAGAKSVYPLQACLYLEQDNLAQDVHNIIIAEEGSELHIITGCATAPHVTQGLHVGISEFYIKKGAKLTFTMIHNWADKVAVRPRSATIVEEGGLFLSNYVCMQPVGTLQMYPVAYLVGEGATARYNSILVAPPGSEIDVGSRVLLKARGTRAEIVSRAITTGGKIIARGHINGLVPEIKAHLECKGLILSDEGVIHAIPELEGHKQEVDLSHEAAVGKIAQEELEYLMARGLSEDEATATIVRGFLHVDIEGLPPELKAEMDKAVEMSEKSLL
ncbi:MAG: SufD family Fe-S cluster assembly protein [Deltaproteobacteria bacterium]|nr:SufD family Fe-S cluster assembly protein [Deltaproteobacteria bacterium]MBW2078564.1 SufD family Fe-S cluster assembly protein [Deltaproteobacteria bacterium]